MSAEHPGQETRQWPGPPPAAERKAAAAEDDFTRDDSARDDSARDHRARVREDSARDDTETAPRRPGTARADADESPAADGGRTAAAGGAPAPAAAAPGTADGQATLLEADHTEEFRRRWDAIKASFVDDPREAVRRAEQLTEEVVAEVARTVDARRRDLIERREGIGDQDDKTGTERLRVVLHGYRSVLDPVLRR